MKQGDIIRFTEGNLAGLLAYITEITIDSENKTRIWYDYVGDGRSDMLKLDKVYQGYTFDTDYIMQSAFLLPQASPEEHK